MKKILSLSLVAALALGFFACKKNASSVVGTSNQGTTTPTTPTTPTPTPAPTSPFGPMPSTFTKKAVIEEETGTWCGYCPNGATEMKAQVAAHPDKVYGIAYHNGDPMTLPMEAAFDGEFNSYGYPGGWVNRILTSNANDAGPNMWGSRINSELAKTADCGLALQSKKVSGSTYSIEVHTGTNTNLSGDYRLVVYLLEDQVHNGSAYDQHNYMDADATSPFFGFGNPMPASKYKHDHVLRMDVTGSGHYGIAIPTTNLKKSSEYTYKTEVDLTTEMNPAEMHVVAMIVSKGLGLDKALVQNAQGAKLGEVKKWD